MKHQRALSCIAAIILILSGPGCGGPAPDSAPATPTQVPPTSTPAPPHFFREEFDAELPDWRFEWIQSLAETGEYRIERSKLVFDLQAGGLSAGLLYDPHRYTDVQMEIQVANIGQAQSYVSLYCRYTPERGWYQMRISSSGFYDFYYYDQVGNSWKKLGRDYSAAVHNGQDVNVYRVACQGDTISLYINGEFTNWVTDYSHGFPEGQIGIGADTDYLSFPILLEIEYLDIRTPPARATFTPNIVGSWQGMYQGDPVLFTFTADGRYIETMKGNAIEGRYTIDYTTTPAWIDLYYDDGFTALSIAEWWDAGTIKIAQSHGTDRPDDFSDSGKLTRVAP